MEHLERRLGTLAFVALIACGCSDGGARTQAAAEVQSCMTCHNGSSGNDYAGPGIEDPHPFGGTAQMLCTTCHGGDGAGDGREDSHIPAPPTIGDREQWREDRLAYFNRLTRVGLDKLPNYVVDGRSYTALDYLQFIAPGDLRVVGKGRGCGQCHAPHAEAVNKSVLATSAGIFSGAMYAAGVDNLVPQNKGLFEDTAADRAPRALIEPDYQIDPDRIGDVRRLLEHPLYSRNEDQSAGQMYKSDEYLAEDFADDQLADGRVISLSPLANVYNEQVAFTCGDCHLGNSGANNRYADFRTSGCSACHMPASMDGRSRSGDPNVSLLEPTDPDDIDAPELPHLRRHRILGIAKTLANGEQMHGVDDTTCAGCHQGSNRTVMQYWGIRLDQNQDLRNEVQYPTNPVEWLGTGDDERLFDPEVGNHTFNGRNKNQYILFEDYDGDGRDDTPADVHHDAGMGCIDCHGSRDLHGDTSDLGAPIPSRMEQGVKIRCESCHGSSDEYAQTIAGTDLDGEPAQLAVDAAGKPLRHVTRGVNGHFFMRSKLTGARHYVRQSLDVVVDNGRKNPLTGEALYSVKASYAMGRDDGDPSTGLGPIQLLPEPSGFRHGDGMSCAACHSSWTNSCIGCHLEGEYNSGDNFSNITGERIVFRERNAEFVYQSPVPFQLGIGPNNKIEPISPNSQAFFKYRDRHGEFTETFAFSNRNASGNNPADAAHPALNHNVMMQHSIRGKVDPKNEGPRACVACHLTETGLTVYGENYETFRTAMRDGDYAALDFDLLRDHFGKNTGNQIDSPLWVHQVAGLGSGLYLFDEDGCPVNPLDDNDDRAGCEGESPAQRFDLTRVVYDLDRIVDESGVAAGSNNHPLSDPGSGPNQREGATDVNMSGPLGWTLIQRLTDPELGIVLDSWFDADGSARGGAGTIIGDGE